MSMFFNSKLHDVKDFIGRLLNSELQDGPRVDSRTTRVLVGMVVPLINQRPQIDQAFTAIATNFSNTGAALAINQPQAPDVAILGFHLLGKTIFFRGKEKHTEPMGGGFYQHGYQLSEVVSMKDYPELESLKL